MPAKLIDKFQHQADTFILHQHGLDHPKISPLDDYDQFDNVDSSLGSDEGEGGPSRHRTSPRTSDGSWMDHINPEDLPILLPSTLGWMSYVSNGVKSLAAKEAQLWVAQANESIHRIHLALGFKSAIFHTQVRTANSQQKKTCAWNAVKSVDTTVHEHAHIYDEQHRCMGLNSHGVSKVSVIDAAGVKQVRAVIECLRQQMRELIGLERSKLLT